MTLFSFVVAFDAIVWEPDPTEFGRTVRSAGHTRASRVFNVVAESLALAKGEVVNDRDFYRHQNPVIESITETPVHRVVIVNRV